MKLKLIYLVLITLFNNVCLSQKNTKALLNKAQEIFYNNPDSSFFLCNQASKFNDEKFKGDIYLCRIRYFLTKSDYEQSESEIIKAVKFFQQKKDLVGLSNAFSYKSILQGRLGNAELSLKYLLKAYNYDKLSGNNISLKTNLVNLTVLYIEKNDSINAKKCLNELETYKYLFDDEYYYYYYQNNGLYFRLINKNDKALSFFLKAKEIAFKHNMLDSKATILSTIAKTYLLEKKFNIAEKYAFESYQISKNNLLKYEEEEALKVLIEIFESQNKFKEAYEFQKLQFNISKDLLNLEKINKINEMNQKVKFLENQKIIQNKNLIINQQTKLNEEIKSKSKILVSFLIFSLISIFIIGFVLLKTKKLNAIISSQKKLVEYKNKEITDSITYAKRIQSAILPQPRLVKEYFKDSFIFYKPKDIVAGDFYWFEVVGDTVLFAAADCTGHGVPGAMVSVVCHNALNRSVKEFALKNPADILNKTREIVIAEFEKADEDVKDGMDISLCAINLKSNVLHWAGAHNPLWVIRNSEIIETKADKQPIGKFTFAKDFTKHEFQLQKDDEIYIFTDGFQDQFGGEKGKKYKVAQLRELLLALNSKTMEEKRTKIEEAFENWKRELEQIDDVCILGVRI